MKQYKVIGKLLTNPKDLEIYLNSQSANGWELVDTFSKGFSIWLILARDADELVLHPRMNKGKIDGSFSGEFATSKVK